ncbi:HNH endonuclease signature motif containing protein [soil metagenome]
MVMTIESSTERTAAELNDEMDSWLAAANTSLAHLLDLVATYDQGELWRADGATSMASWLTFQYGLSLRTAQAWVETALALVDLPALRVAFSEGRLSFDQVRFACRLATPETDACWAEEAPTYSVSRLEVMARRRRHIAAAESNDAYRQRSLRMRWDLDHRFLHLWGQLPEEAGTIFEQAVNRIADRYGKNPETGVFDPFEVRAADALVELASQHLGADGAADRATVVFHVTAEALRTENGSGEIEDGPGLSIETVKRLICDSRMELVLEDSHGVPIGVGRTRRTIPPWLLRVLRRRDQGCRFPGCHHQRWVNAHHIRFWMNGGSTDLDNLILLCPFHHRMLHEEGWRIEGNPNGPVTWFKPDGRPYLSKTGP